MIVREVLGERLPMLGFGTMRLPQLPDGRVDEAASQALVDRAMANGINYFDTAYPYHNFEGERILGRLLRGYDRGSYYLATKFPGHQICSSYDPADIFEAQLKNCGVEYFDFYLLHNVYEKSMDTYLDPRWGILDYLKEQKRLGRIRHLGFSSHGRLENLRTFLDRCGADMEFCQIQLNYLDWTLQQGKEKYELLTRSQIPVWVMEPIRGGKLANLPEQEAASLRVLRPLESVPAWSFRFLQDLPNVAVVLSGMSAQDQLDDNIRTFRAPAPLTEEERRALLAAAEQMKDSVPCTGCRYCCDGCPAGLDIPMLLSIYNESRYAPTLNQVMTIEALPEEKRPAACIACGQCSRMCPQGIEIPQVLQNLDFTLKSLPSWDEICRQREKAKQT